MCFGVDWTKGLISSVDLESVGPVELDKNEMKYLNRRIHQLGISSLVNGDTGETKFKVKEKFFHHALIAKSDAIKKIDLITSKKMEALLSIDFLELCVACAVKNTRMQTNSSGFSFESDPNDKKILNLHAMMQELEIVHKAISSGNKVDKLRMANLISKMENKVYKKLSAIEAEAISKSFNKALKLLRKWT